MFPTGGGRRGEWRGIYTTYTLYSIQYALWGTHRRTVLWHWIGTPKFCCFLYFCVWINFIIFCQKKGRILQKMFESATHVMCTQKCPAFRKYLQPKVAAPPPILFLHSHRSAKINRRLSLMTSFAGTQLRMYHCTICIIYSTYSKVVGIGSDASFITRYFFKQINNDTNFFTPKTVLL